MLKTIDVTRKKIAAEEKSPDPGRPSIAQKSCYRWRTCWLTMFDLLQVEAGDAEQIVENSEFESL